MKYLHIVIIKILSLYRESTFLSLWPPWFCLFNRLGQELFITQTLRTLENGASYPFLLQQENIVPIKNQILRSQHDYFLSSLNCIISNHNLKIVWLEVLSTISKSTYLFSTWLLFTSVKPPLIITTYLALSVAPNVLFFITPAKSPNFIIVSFARYNSNPLGIKVFLLRKARLLLCQSSTQDSGSGIVLVRVRHGGFAREHLYMISPLVSRDSSPA